MCQVILIAADLDTITVSAEKSNAIMLVFCSLVSLVRNSVVLAVYLFFTLIKIYVHSTKNPCKQHSHAVCKGLFLLIFRQVPPVHCSS